MDIIFSFFTAYTADVKGGLQAGSLVTSMRLIAKNYLKTWFCIDFTSTIPWGVLADVLSGGDSSSKSAKMAKLTKIVKFVRFLRLMRMLRLAKLAAIWERVESSMGSLFMKQFVAFLRVMLVLAGICHWNACIWWMIGQPQSLITELLSDDAQEAFQNAPHWTTVTRGSPGNEWNWLNRTQSDQYIFSFYWTLGVMRTMPAEVQPENQTERLYVMVFMFFAFSAFAICVALITQTFFKFSERKRKFDDDMAAVRMYMRTCKADDFVQKTAKAFLRHLYETRKIQAPESNMLAHLPPALYSKMKLERLRGSLMKISFFKLLPSKALLYVSEVAELRDVPAGAPICHCGRVSEAAWVTVSGCLHARRIKDPKTKEPEFVLTEVVDEECLLTTKTHESAESVWTSICSELMRVDKAKFQQVMSNHEQFRKSLQLEYTCRFKSGMDTDIGIQIMENDTSQIASIAAVVAG
jgi:hypothetical protein